MRVRLSDRVEPSLSRLVTSALTASASLGLQRGDFVRHRPSGQRQPSAEIGTVGRAGELGRQAPSTKSPGERRIICVM